MKPTAHVPMGRDRASVAGKQPPVEESTDLLIVGAGAAGISAALAAAGGGVRVTLVDENPVPLATMGEDVPLHFGGRMAATVANRNGVLESVLRDRPQLMEAIDAGVDVRLGTAAWGLFPRRPAACWIDAHVAGLADEERAYLLGFRQVIVATGCRDMGLAFDGWQRAGVMGAAAAYRLATLYEALDARTALLLGSGAEALQIGNALLDAGLRIAAVVEQAAAAYGPQRLLTRLIEGGARLFTRHVIQQAVGDSQGVAAVRLARVDAQGYRVGDRCERVECDTVLLGAAAAGWGASGRNGGGCSHHHSPLFREEQRLWPLLDDMLGYPTEFQPWRLRIALDERQSGLYRRALENGERQGFRTEVLDPGQVRELVPHANPHRTLQAYAWAMRDRGGRLLQHTPALDFETRGNRVVAVRTRGGTQACDQLVIAAGPATGRLAALLGLKVPLRSARAEMIVTEPLPLMRLGGVDGNGLYGRQTLRGNLAYGGGPHEWIDDEDVERTRPYSTPLQASIARRLCALLPKAAHARVIRNWAGFIENTPDGRPIIDRPAALENVTIATLSSVGFGLSPAAGRAVRDLVMTASCGFADLSSLTLERFARLEPDWRRLQGWLPSAVGAGE